MSQRRAAVRRHELLLLAVLLLLRAGLSIAYSLATPLGEAPDEADHYAYAAYIMAEGRLPAGAEITQAKHPPLYYLIAAAAGRLAGGSGGNDFLRANPDMSFERGSPAVNFFVHTALEDAPWRDGVLTMRAGRFVSMLAGLAFVLVTYLLGRTLWPRRPELALGGAAFAAFLPESLFISGAMSNDMLAAMWSALALLFTARLVLIAPLDSDPPSGRPRPLLIAFFAGLSLGLAFVTKASTGSLAVVIAAAIFVNAWQACRRSARMWPALGSAAIRVTVVGLAALLVAAPWLWRNWQLHGDPFGWPLVLATIDRRVGPLTTADVVQLARGWWLSFWGKFGGAGHIPLPTWLYVLWGITGAAAAAGWALWIARRSRNDMVAAPGPGGWVLLLGAPVVTALGIYSYSQTALGTDQGRLLFPALAPLALLLYGGLAAWAPPGRQRSASLVFTGAMALVAVAGLYWGLGRPFAPPPEPPAAEIAAATPVTARFGPLDLAAVAWDRPAQDLLTLYWQARESTTEDLRTGLQLVDPAGNVLWEWKRSPGGGRFSTDRWPAGRIVSDTYRPPPGVLDRAASLRLGVRTFPEGPWLPVDDLPAGQLLTLPR